MRKKEKPLFLERIPGQGLSLRRSERGEEGLFYAPPGKSLIRGGILSLRAFEAGGSSAESPPHTPLY